MKSYNFHESGNVYRNENLERYRIEMAKYKPLSDDTLRELIEMAQEGDAKALEKVVKANLRIIWSIAKVYNGLDNFEDILQNGNIGLIKAVETFDIDRNVKFVTWAAEIVRKYINIGLTNESRVVRMSAHLVRDKANTYLKVSFDAPLATDDDKDKAFIDTFSSQETTDAFAELEDVSSKINCLFNGISDKEKAIICKLFGIGCREHTQLELSLEYGCSSERIRQIKFEALDKMKKYAEHHA